jgi:hypothetical protein
MLPQQQAIKEAADACGIHKGMSREDLVKALTGCVPEFHRKKKEEVSTRPPPENTPVSG